jgi:hypothetical protein
MNIENRLKEDAERIAGIQPPADLSCRLRTSLEGVPAQTRRWFKPAMAVLTAAMLVVVLLPGNSSVPSNGSLPEALPSANEESKVNSPEIEQETGTRGGEVHWGLGKDNFYKEPTPAQDPPPQANPAPLKKAPPWGRVGTFSGLTLIAGILWASELWRRRVALAVVIPLVALILGNSWLLRDIIF